jgi:uncharacterized protein YndB with AHSA1/START domain
MKSKSLQKQVTYDHGIESVWTALTDARALAEWMFPNNFKAEVGHRFRFQIDPMMGTSRWTRHDCMVMEVEPPKKLVYNWVVAPAKPDDPPHHPMVLTWTLESLSERSTRLTLQVTGLEFIGFWARFSMKMGWGRMLGTLLPKVLANCDGPRFTPGAIPLNKRDYRAKTVPEELTR